MEFGRLRTEYAGVRIVAFPPIGRAVTTRTVTLTSVGTVVTATISSGTFAGPDGMARISTTTIASVAGNVLTISPVRAAVLPVGSVVRPSVTSDGVHPYPVMVDRIAAGIAQSEKLKFNS
ncbi:UNVERIFIED_ORG: hypothetical protein GGE63_005809 [Rhizobium esperanzae]|nr:hypothetical protein [Rhizobium phaseoli]